MNSTRASATFTQFALLGSGRLARHLAKYFEILNLPFVSWSRANDPYQAELWRVCESSSHILFAVSDSAIEELAGQVLKHDGGGERVLVHFSGALSVPGVFAAHPLMTFGLEIDDKGLDWFRSIPFVVDPAVEFLRLLPGLPNLNFALAPEHRAFYHALCSLAGNSTHLLWQKIGAEFERLGLPATVLRPYLHQVVENFSSTGNFTGPVARGDWSVVREHQRSLASRGDLLDSYRDFLRLARSAGVQLPKDLQ